MPDEEIMEMWKKKRRRFWIFIGVFAIITATLAVVHIMFLYILALVLMVVGVISMMNAGAQMARWKYFTLPVQYGGFHEHEIAARNEKERLSEFGMVMAGVGFALFLVSLYISSLGWTGLA